MFIKNHAESANDPAFSRQALQEVNSTPSKIKQASSSFATSVKSQDTENAAHLQQVEQDPKQRICHACNGSHDIDNCPEFAQKTLDEKKDFFKKKGLCFGCVSRNHMVKGCIKRRVCSKCKGRHPTCLHDDDYQPKREVEPAKEDSASSSACTTYGEANVVLQSILPVKIQQNDGIIVDTYCFYDNGSTGCFMSEELKEQLGADASETTLRLRTLHGAKYVKSSVITYLKVMDVNGNNEVELPKTFTQPDMPVSPEQIPRKDALIGIPHLENLAKKLPDFNPNLNIGLLIGSNCPEALQPIRVIPSENKGPFGVQYKHGWTVNGPVELSTNENSQITCNRIVLQEVTNVK